MTYEEREKIFSKDCITSNDLMLLFDIGVASASQLMQAIKRKTGDKLGIAGRIATQDYLDYFGITDQTRYGIPPKVTISTEELSEDDINKVIELNEKANK